MSLLLPIYKAMGLQATVHASLGRWLVQQQQPQRAVGGPSLQVVDAPGTGLQGHPLIVLWGARICASFGSLLVVLLVGCPRLFLSSHL